MAGQGAGRHRDRRHRRHLNLKLPHKSCAAAVEGLNTVPWVTVHGMKINRSDLELFQLMKTAAARGLASKTATKHAAQRHRKARP